MPTIRRARPLLGTLVEIQAHGTEGDDAALDRAVESAFAAVAEIQRLMSVHDPDSEASRINREAYRRPVALSAATQTVLSTALQLAEDSDGAFDVVVGGRLQQLGLLPGNGAGVDPAASWRDIELVAEQAVRLRRPMHLDFGGIAKGYAVDCAVAALQAAGVASAMVNAGGDLRVFGTQAQIIGIRDPRNPAAIAKSLSLQTRALATSGSYRSRREAANGGVSALIEPGSGKPYLGADSITVTAASCIYADALTKVVLFASAECSERLLEKYAAEALLLSAGGGASMR